MRVNKSSDNLKGGYVLEKGKCEIVFEKSINEDRSYNLLLDFEDVTKEQAIEIKESLFSSDPTKALANDYKGNSYTKSHIKAVNFIPYEKKINLL